MPPPSSTATTSMPATPSRVRPDTAIQPRCPWASWLWPTSLAAVPRPLILEPQAHSAPLSVGDLFDDRAAAVGVDPDVAGQLRGRRGHRGGGEGVEPTGVGQIAGRATDQDHVVLAVDLHAAGGDGP